MVLAGYGGASLLFFGVSPWLTSPLTQTKAPTSSNEKEAEEAQLESAINAAEAEVEGISGTLPSASEHMEYSWWDILMGKHDKEIFERSVHGDHPDARDAQARMRATAVIGVERQMPRFWVLTDHHRKQVVLVLRGMSRSSGSYTSIDESLNFMINRNYVPERVGSRLDM
jgi:hypothetical protein